MLVVVLFGRQYSSFREDKIRTEKRPNCSFDVSEAPDELLEFYKPSAQDATADGNVPSSICKN